MVLSTELPHTRVSNGWAISLIQCLPSSVVIASCAYEIQDLSSGL
jgi:hypothetical protein